MHVRLSFTIGVLLWNTCMPAQAVEKVVDLPTRPGVTQRLLLTEVPGGVGVTGGITRGDPCEAEVVQRTVAWMLAK